MCVFRTHQSCAEIPVHMYVYICVCLLHLALMSHHVVARDFTQVGAVVV